MRNDSSVAGDIEKEEGKKKRSEAQLASVCERGVLGGKAP